MNQPVPAPKKSPTGAFVFAGVIIALFIDLPVGRLLGSARGLLRSTGSGRTLDPSLIAAIIGAGGYSFALAALLTALTLLTIACRRARHSIQAKAARSPNTPMITGSHDTMICMQEERQGAWH